MWPTQPRNKRIRPDAGIVREGRALGTGPFRVARGSGGWFWLTSVSRNRVVNQIRKMLSAVPAVPACGTEARRFKTSSNARVSHLRGVYLLEICSRRPECVVEGECIRQKPRACARTKTYRQPKIIVCGEFRALWRHRSARRSRRRRLGGWRLDALWYGASFRTPHGSSKYGTRLYGFRGLQVGLRSFESLIRKTERARTNKDYGWKPDGEDLACVRILSEAVVNSGVFNVPAALRAYVFGDFEMRDDDGVVIGRIRVRENGCWGLFPCFRGAAANRATYCFLCSIRVARQVEPAWVAKTYLTKRARVMLRETSRCIVVGSAGDRTSSQYRSVLSGGSSSTTLVLCRESELLGYLEARSMCLQPPIASTRGSSVQP